MSAAVICDSCCWNKHHPGDERGQHTPGVLGGWHCSCSCVRGEVPPDQETPLEKLLAEVEEQTE